MKVAVIQFLGSNCDLDSVWALRQIGVTTDLVYYKDFEEIYYKYDGILIPGGFSWGDYLRAGVIAANTSCMKLVCELSESDVPILGICNGFQILTEAGLLPGALIRNDSLSFICKWVTISVESKKSVFTKDLVIKSQLKMPIAHGEGRFATDDLNKLYKNNQVVFKYLGENPNGSMDAIAGVTNLNGNVLGLMPHPERASDNIIGGKDGLKILKYFLT